VTLREDDFEGFIAERQRTLMGKSIVMSDEPVPDDEVDEDD
jgi:hypothetical protein